MLLYLNISPERKSIKKALGQANHFLITILIGLDGIIQENIDLPEDFSTSWNPKDKQKSVDRSREFALKSALAWTVDCLDAYFISCNQKPTLISNPDFINKLNGAHRSIHEKSKIFSSYVADHSEKFELYQSMTELAIQWRNNTTHSNAENKLEENSVKILRRNSQLINNDFCGLDIDSMLDHFLQGKKPTFKEVTSMIRAIQLYIEEIDNFLLKALNLNRYAKETIEVFFTKYNQERKLFNSLKKERKISKISTILQNNSFTKIAKNQNYSPSITIDENFISMIF